MNVEIEIQDLKQMTADLLRSQIETDRKFQETDRKFQETDRKFQETDRRFQEMERLLTEKFQETDRKFQETDRRFQETDRLLTEKFQETDRLLTEKFQETDRLLTEQSQEADRRFQEMERMLTEQSQETDRRFQETDKRIKEAFNLFEGQWGKLMESLVEGDLVRILRERGVDVTDTQTRRKGNKNGKSFEFDIIANDNTEVVIVEVKTTLRAKHVKAFLNKMDQVKELLPEYRDYQVMGGVAFLRAEESSDAMAEKRGLFVIRATGDSAALVNKPGFVPKVY